MIREGDTAEQIIKLIDEDADIGILVLAAGTGKEGPGPLVTNLAKTAGTVSDPGRDRAGPSERRRYRRQFVNSARVLRWLTAPPRNAPFMRYS